MTHFEDDLQHTGISFREKKKRAGYESLTSYGPRTVILAVVQAHRW